MKLYHYIPKNCEITDVGLLSVSKLPKELLKYAKRVGSNNLKNILNWMEQTFPGRSRAISVLTEPVQWKNNDPMLKEWIDTKTLIEINFDQLFKDELIEAIWCKNGSDTDGNNETLFQITPDKIEKSPLNWNQCSKEKGLFFGVIKHYLLVMKQGTIPPKYFSIIKSPDSIKQLI